MFKKFLHLKYPLLLSCISLVFTSASAQENLYYHDEYSDNQEGYTLSLPEMQFIINIVYLFMANSLLELKVREFNIPITKLTHNINHVTSGEKIDSAINNDIATLKVLCDRLQVILQVRTIYQEMLLTCQQYYTQTASAEFKRYVESLFTLIYQKLEAIVSKNMPDLFEHIDPQIKTFCSAVSSLEKDAEFYQIHITPERFYTTQNIISFIMQHNASLQSNAQTLINTKNEIDKIAIYVIEVLLHIYTSLYTQMYEYLLHNSPDLDQLKVLFGVKTLLNDQDQAVLPHPDNIFKYVLETAKQYTHITVTQ